MQRSSLPKFAGALILASGLVFGSFAETWAKSGGSVSRSSPSNPPASRSAAPLRAPAPLRVAPASPQLVKPPFTATPLGQKLTPQFPVTNNARATPTANSRLGGYPGYTRSGTRQFHGGLDDPAYSSPATSRYTGNSTGVVRRAGEAHNTRGQSLGQRVEIETKDRAGNVWTSKSMHHENLFVKPGQIVLPGQIIGRGAGVGDQFRRPGAGGPHVHWEVYKNGKPVDPLNGSPIRR